MVDVYTTISVKQISVLFECLLWLHWWLLAVTLVILLHMLASFPGPCTRAWEWGYAHAYCMYDACYYISISIMTQFTQALSTSSTVEYSWVISSNSIGQWDITMDPLRKWLSGLMVTRTECPVNNCSKPSNPNLFFFYLRLLLAYTCL